MPPAVDDVAKAFGMGSDQRLRGDRCSYPEGMIVELRRSWRRGWDDVQNSWGRNAKWPVRRLRRLPVGNVASGSKLP